MHCKIIEAVTAGDDNNLCKNWGKFAVMRFDDEEFDRPSVVSPLDETPLMRQLGIGPSLLSQRGWGRDHIIVLDIETCEAAGLNPGGSAYHDLNKHCIWVCPLFEPFLQWLYGQDLTDLSALPDLVEVEAEFEIAGYRRPGLNLMGLAEIAKEQGITGKRALQALEAPGVPQAGDRAGDRKGVAPSRGRGVLPRPERQGRATEQGELMRWIFEATIGPEHIDVEDSGVHMIYHLSDDSHPELYVRLLSEDETGEHEEIRMLEGRRVRVTVEVVD